MKVKILKGTYGLFGAPYEPGESADLMDALAKEMIEAGYAEKAESEEIETAESKVKPEKAVKRK